MQKMVEGYDISLSRTPDGKVVATTDADVPMASGCLVGAPNEQTDSVYVHLDVTHNGRRFPVWVCQPGGNLTESDLESRIVAEMGPDIVAAVKRIEQP